MPLFKKTTVSPNTYAAAKPAPAHSKAQTKTTKTKSTNNAAKPLKTPTYPAFSPQMNRM